MSPAPERAETSADKAACILCERHGPVQKEDILRVARLLFSSTHRQNRFSANPVGKTYVNGGVLGATSPLGKGVAALKSQNFSWSRTRNVAKLFNRWRDQQLGISSDGEDVVRPTSIQVNMNFEGAVHVDGNNLGPSHIVAVGDFENGALLLEDPKGDVNRELVCSSGGNGTKAALRTPGIYRFRRVDVRARNGLQLFNGATHLHCAEKSIGERFTFVWFSVHADRLATLSDDDVRSLRDYGFRPRSQDDLHKLKVQTERLPNDRANYDSGFLRFCRDRRPEMENTFSSNEATAKLRDAWASLIDGAGADPDSINESTKEYWRGCECLERSSRKLRAKKHMIDRRSVASPQRTSRTVLETLQSLPGRHVVEQHGSHLPNIDEVSDDHVILLEVGEDHTAALKAFCDRVFVEFPAAVQPNGENLFIKVLEQFGFTNLDEASRAWDAVQRRKQEITDEELAGRIDRHQKVGRRVTFMDSSIVESPIPCQDSSEDLDGPDGKRQRTLSPDAAGLALTIVLVDSQDSHADTSARSTVPPVESAGSVGGGRLQTSARSASVQQLVEITGVAAEQAANALKDANDSVELAVDRLLSSMDGITAYYVPDVD